jgi:hypothetical protein
VHEEGAQTGDHAIGSAQVGSSLPTAIQEDLMPSERRFRDDSTKATRFYKPGDGEEMVKATSISRRPPTPSFLHTARSVQAHA